MVGPLGTIPKNRMEAFVVQWLPSKDMDSVIRCNTMQVVRQADDSFVCFGAKPDKGFWTRDLDVTGSGKGTPVRE